LADSSEDRILAYARKWGMLQLCKHDFPAYHSQIYWPAREVWSGSKPCYIRGEPEGPLWEPVESWRVWARRARATLRIAADLYKGKLGELVDWQAAVALEYVPVERLMINFEKTVERRWGELNYLLNYWLALGPVQPWIERRNGTEVITFGGDGGLFAALATQLTLMVARADGISLCTNCGNPYSPTRKPRSDQRRYCSVCRKGKYPLRHGAADYRARVVKARELAAKGVPFKSIVNTLRRDPKAVQGWIRRAGKHGKRD
jgi:transposase-like protein